MADSRTETGSIQAELGASCSTRQSSPPPPKAKQNTKQTKNLPRPKTTLHQWECVEGTQESIEIAASDQSWNNMSDKIR